MLLNVIILLLNRSVQMFGLEKEEIIRRNFLVYLWARFVSNTGYRILSRSHTESAVELKKLKKENAVFLYTGLHKSLWETTGVLSSIYYQGMPIPFASMGDNLVKGKFFQTLTSKAGVFLVKRARTRRDIIKSAQKLKSYILFYMADGTDVVIFPEGTRRIISETGRHGNFFPTAFEAVLEYEKNKENILKEHQELTARDVYVVPFNVDYSKIREDFELVAQPDAKPRTLHIFDSLKMIKHIGDLYLSFGEPIKIGAHIDKNRKELAAYTREKCLELVKILPINIAARAILDAGEENRLNRDNVLTHIQKNIDKLAHLEERFRGFSAGESPLDILNKVARYEKKFRKIEAGHLPIYRLYAGYINHYVKTDEN